MIRSVEVAPGRHVGAAAAGFVLLVIAAAWALTADAIHVGPGAAGEIKGDDAVYVAAALSAAFDGNFSFEQRDLERFAGLYHRGPEGIFLKRGKTLRLRVNASLPFIHLEKRPDPHTDRLYFGKALIYPMVAAPFVRAFGLNGLVLLNVLLLAIVAVCAYLFLAVRSSSLGAALFTSAFLGASALPVYLVFFMPEIFNVALVVLGYFLWCYREVATSRRLRGAWPQIAAAALLGLATYSKPFNAILVAPFVLLPWSRREWTRGVVLGAVAVAVAALCFVFNAAVSGEFNYQGGDRQTFYGSFPFDGSGDVWNRRTSQVVTPEENVQARLLTGREWPIRFARNAKYFMVGRHFGFIPYFFPGAVAVGAWLLSNARRDRWRILVFLASVASVVFMLLLLPYTWSGGGGPTGNRYLLSVYGVLLFLIPPGNIAAAGVLGWLGGALFTAKILVNPLLAAKYPYLTTERGAVRRLPVELSMVNDLPVMLAGPSRARIPYGHDPTMLLYFLDQNSFPPEPPGMWVAGGRRTDIALRTLDPIDHLVVESESPIRTVLTVSMGAESVTKQLVPGKIETLNVPARGVPYARDLQSYSYVYLLSASSSEGFVPVLRDPTATARDYRNLGALMRFAAVTSAVKE